MRHFKTEVLAQAIRLRARSAEAPAWLSEARSALAEHAAGKSTPRELALALAAAPQWPASTEELVGELDALAEPIAQLVSKSLCRITKDAQGHPSAELWGGAARASALPQGGVALRSESSIAGLGSPEELARLEAFNDAGWLAEPPGAAGGSLNEPATPASSEEGAPAANQDTRALLAQMESVGEGFMEDVAKDRGMSVDELSARDKRIHDQVNLSFAKPMEPSAQVLLMSDGELIEQRDYARHGSESEARGAPANIKAAGGVGGSAGQASGAVRDIGPELGAGLLGLGPSASQAIGSFRKEAFESARRGFSEARVNRSAQDGSPERGFERGEELLRAAAELGSRTLGRAKVIASERLGAFLAAHGVEPTPSPAAEPGGLSGVADRLAARRQSAAGKQKSKPRSGL